jgi:sec-independent protein translocase protein TatC
MWRNFKYALLGIFIIGAVLSPGQDPVGQIAMAGPMVVLYLIGIVFAWMFGKKKPAEEA